MITLTTPPTINTVIGGNAPVGYDKLVMSDIRLDPITGHIRAAINMSSTGTPQMDAVRGTLHIDWDSKRIIVSVPQLDFFKSANLTAGQQNAVTTIIADAQNALESGVITLGFIDGIQTPGA